MAVWMPGKGLKLDGETYLKTPGDVVFGSDYPRFYIRVSFKLASNPPAGSYQYIIAHSNKFYIRAYTNQYLQTFLQMLIYTNTGDYIYFSSHINLDQASLDETVGGNPHIQNDPFTYEFYWDGTRVWYMLNGHGAQNMRWLLSGDHLYENPSPLVVGADPAGNNRFFGTIDDIVIGTGWPWGDSDVVSRRWTWLGWGENLNEDTGSYTHVWDWEDESGNDKIGDWHLTEAVGYPAYAEGVLGSWAGETVVVYREVPLLRARLRGKRLRGRIAG